MSKINKYEIVCMLGQDMSLPAVDALKSFVESIFAKNQANIIKQENWGIRNLAYPIKGNVNSTYIFFVIEASSEAILEIEDELKREMTIIRYFIKKVKYVSDKMSYLAETATNELD